VGEDAAFAPFGEQYVGGGFDSVFTGSAFQDKAGDLWDFVVREYHPTQGRWISPDPAGQAAVDVTDPQTWNRYVYVRNNPLALVDPSGLNPNDWEPVEVCDFQLPIGWDIEEWYQHCQRTYGQKPTTGGSSRSGTPGSQGSGQPANNSLKQKISSAIPSGRTTGVSGAVGGVGSPGGGGELVVNYNSGQVSAFGFGGFQVGWNGGVSGSVYSGFVWGLNNSNSNYSGGFTGANGGAGAGGFVASSSGGLTGGPGGLIPNPRGVTAAGVSFGAGLLGGFAGGVTATNYTNLAQLGKCWAFGPLDWLLYAARQACQ
jgi:RHS repeat-associated protein